MAPRSSQSKKKATPAKSAGKPRTPSRGGGGSTPSNAANASGQKRKRDTAAAGNDTPYTPKTLAEQRKKMAEDYKKKKEGQDKEPEEPEESESPVQPRPHKRQKRATNSETAPQKAATAKSTARKPPPTRQSVTQKTPPRSTTNSGATKFAFQSPAAAGRMNSAAIATNPSHSDNNGGGKDDDNDEEEEGVAIPAPKPTNLKPAGTARRGLLNDANMANFAAGGDGGDDGDDDEDDDGSNEDDDSSSGEESESSDDKGRDGVDENNANNIRSKLRAYLPLPSLQLCVLVGVLVLAWISPLRFGLFDSFTSRLPSGLFAFRNAFMTSENVCFRDSRRSLDEEDDVPVSHLCVGDDQPILWKQCPMDAYCRGGSLLQCPDGFFVDSHGCFLDATSNETLRSVLELLQKWTAEDVCDGNPERFQDYGYGGRPLFHFSRVAGELEMGYSPTLVKVGNNSRFLLLSPRKDEIWIGLHPSVDVPLSFSCRAELAVVAVCSWVYENTMMLVVLVVQTLFSAFWKAPIPVGFAMMSALFLFRYVYNESVKKAAKKQFEKDVYKCREAAIQILLSNPTKGLSMDDLAEKVAWKLYAMSRVGRDRVTTVVMPKLASELKNHRNVKLERHVHNGIPVDKLQWVGSS